MPPAMKSQIHSAAAKGDCLAVVAALKNGEHVDSLDISRQSALHWAARKGQTSIIAILLANNADIDLRNKHGRTPMELAKEHENPSVVEFLERIYLMKAGKPIRRGGSPRKTPTKPSASSPIKAKKHRTAEDLAELEASAIEWVKNQADRYLKDAQEAYAEAQALVALEEAEKGKQEQQSEKIQKLKNLVKQMKGIGSDADGAEFLTPVKSPSIVRRDISNLRSSSNTPKVQSPAGHDFIKARQDSVDRKKAEAAKRKANAAKIREMSAKRAKVAQERKEAAEAEKRAMVEKQREATRLANERAKKSRERKAKSAATATAMSPIVAVSLDASLYGDAQASPHGSPVRPAKAIGSTRRSSRSSNPGSARRDGATSKLSTQDVKVKTNKIVTKPSVLTLKARGEDTKPKKKSIFSTKKLEPSLTTPQTPKTPKTAKTSSARIASSVSTKKRSSSPDKSKIPAPNSLNSPARNKESREQTIASGESVEMGSLEAEYIQMMRGISSKPGFGNDSSSSVNRTQPQSKPVVPEAVSVAGAGANVGEETKTFTIIKLEGSGLGVGIFSTKSAAGVRVKNIVAGSPFEKAGVKEGYRFIRIGRELATNHDTVVSLLKSSASKFEVEMGVPVISPTTPAQAKDKAAVVIQRSLQAFFEGVKPRQVTIRRPSSNAPLGVALFSIPEDKVVQVDRLVPGGPCALAGIKENDAILKVNGTSVISQTHTEVIHLLKASDANIVLDVASMQDVIDNLSKLALNSSESEAFDSDQYPESPEKKVLPKECIDFTIRRRPSAKLGVALMTMEKSDAIVLHSVTAEGPFGEAGVPEGYIIHKVNGVDMKSHSDVVEALSNAPDQFTVSVSAPETENRSIKPVSTDVPVTQSESNSASDLPLKRYNVTRIPNKGLGIALYSNKKSVGVRISQVNAGGPVALAGIKAGEVIVQINGVSMLKSSHDEVVEQFKNAPKSFVVVTVPAAEFDNATGNAITKSSDSSSKDDAKSTLLEFDEMRFDKQNNRKSLFGGPGHSTVFDESQDEMRSYSNFQSANADDRLASFSGLNNTEGFMAAKQAQAQALSLIKATKDYDIQFQESPGRPDGKRLSSSSIGAESPNRDLKESVKGSMNSSMSSQTPSPSRLAVDSSILSNWEAEFSPTRGPRRSPVKKVRGRRTAMI